MGKADDDGITPPQGEAPKPIDPLDFSAWSSTTPPLPSPGPVSNAPPPIKPLRHTATVVAPPPSGLLPSRPMAVSMTTDKGSTDPLPDIPPEWLPLTDLPGSVARWYGVSVATVAAEVVEAVWTGGLRTAHRIAGVEPRGHYRKLPCGLVRKNEGAWGKLLDVDGRAVPDSWIVADDWTVAEVDRRDGTVGGWAEKDGPRKRLSIEVLWKAVKDFSAIRVWRWKQENVPHLPSGPGRVAPSVAPVPVTASRGGAPAKYDWNAFTRELIRTANLSGFATRTEMAAHMREWVAENWRAQPDERTLQRKLAERYPTDLPG